MESGHRFMLFVKYRISFAVFRDDPKGHHCPRLASLLVLLAVLCLTNLAATPVHSYIDPNGVLVYFTVNEEHTDIDGLPALPPDPPAPGAVLTAERTSPFDAHIAKYAQEHSVDPDLVRAVIAAESDFNPSAVSNRGAIGLMQLIPATAKRFGVANAFRPEQNIEGGVKYLRFLLDTFQNDLKLVLAAYNAGENVVRRYGGIPPYAETQNYVRRITGRYGETYRTAVAAAPASVAKPEEVPGYKIYRVLDPTRNVVVYTNRPGSSR